MKIPFGTQSYRSDSLPLACQRMLNCYLESSPPLAKTPISVRRIPGRTLFADCEGAFRGAYRMAGELFVVAGTTLYSISSGGTKTSLGTIPGAGRVFMADNGTQLFVVTTPEAYIYESGAVTQVTDTDFPGALWADFIDGYFTYVEPDSGRFGITSLYDGTAVDGLDFATAESSPDDIRGALIDYPDVLLFGEESAESWYNSGDSDFPFQRSPQGVIKCGVAGKFALCKADNSVVLLDQKGIARRLDGYSPVRISTYAIELEFARRDISTCRVFSWTEYGHEMVGFIFDDGCFVFDLSTQLWHERESYGAGRWNTEYVMQCYGEWLAFDVDGKIGTLNREVYQEYTTLIVAVCTSPSVADENQWMEHSSLELLFECGVGLSTGQGSAPVVMLRWSDDGGRTWSNYKSRSLGLMGEFKHRVRFNRLGRSRDRVYEWSVSDPVKLVFMEATLNA